MFLFLRNYIKTLEPRGIKLLLNYIYRKKKLMDERRRNGRYEKWLIGLKEHNSSVYCD